MRKTHAETGCGNSALRPRIGKRVRTKYGWNDSMARIYFPALKENFYFSNRIFTIYVTFFLHMTECQSLQFLQERNKRSNKTLFYHSCFLCLFVFFIMLRKFSFVVTGYWISFVNSSSFLFQKMITFVIIDNVVLMF